MGRRQERASLEHALTRLQIPARGTDVIAKLCFRQDRHVVAIGSRSFHHDNRVRAVRQRRAGHDADRLARADRDARRSSGRQFPDDS